LPRVQATPAFVEGVAGLYRLRCCPCLGTLGLNLVPLLHGMR